MKILTNLLLAWAIVFSATAAANAAGCAAKANAVASRSNGRVLAVSTVNQGGRQMCRITVLVKSRKGRPARKKTIVVPK